MAHAAFSWSAINNGDIYGERPVRPMDIFVDGSGGVEPIHQKRGKIPESYEVIFVKVKKTLKIVAACLVLAIAVAMSVSAVTRNSVTLTKTMYYVSGAANSFESAQASYHGQTYEDSSCACRIYLFGKTASSNTGVSSIILDIGEDAYSIGPFTASRYGVESWYAYAQPHGSSSGLGGHCIAQAYSN